MPFDQSTITDPRAARDDVSLIVSWASTLPEGTIFQIYVDSKLAWSGRERRAILPYPGPDRSITVDIGAVGAGESSTNFAADLPAVPGGGSRVRLEWQGGAYLSPDIEAFDVYMGTAPGGAVDYGAAVATLSAYTAGVATTTFGDGTFGGGAFGYPSASYAWTSPSLAPGLWWFGIAARDGAGNASTPEEISATIDGPPAPPAADAAGVRLQATYDDATGEATLTWLASPG